MNLNQTIKAINFIATNDHFKLILSEKKKFNLQNILTFSNQKSKFKLTSLKKSYRCRDSIVNTPTTLKLCHMFNFFF